MVEKNKKTQHNVIIKLNAVFKDLIENGGFKHVRKFTESKSRSGSGKP